MAQWEKRQADQTQKAEGRQLKRKLKDQLVTAAIREELEEAGLVRFKTKHVLARLLEHKVEELKFGPSDVTRTLKERFHMFFGHLSAVDYVKRNHDLAERRKWVSRLLV